MTTLPLSAIQDRALRDLAKGPFAHIAAGWRAIDGTIYQPGTAAALEGHGLAYIRRAETCITKRGRNYLVISDDMERALARAAAKREAEARA